MEHSTPGNPQMNSTSDPSVVDDQTVNLRDPLTMAPVSDEHMCRKLKCNSVNNSEAGGCGIQFFIMNECITFRNSFIRFRVQVK